MQKFLGASLVSLALMGFAASATAVDIVNRDLQPHEVIIDDLAGSNQGVVEIQPGETLENVCETCELTVGDSEPVSVIGDQIALIINGVLQVHQK